ncbi:MAG: pilus assembly protein CpaD [Rhizobium sp.]|nr:pilus assembly protein CpaD [Rhizobium sp.]
MLNTKATIPHSASHARGLTKLAGMVAVVVAGSLLSGCGAARPDRQTTSSVPDDYRTRHAISLAEAEHSLDVPIGSGEQKLTPATRDLIKGFAQDYAALSKGMIRIGVPMNAANSAAANSVRSEIRRVLIDAGVSSSRIVQTNYNSQTADASAPVRLTFVAVTAVTDECGQWPTDLTGESVTKNTNYENFGCATQQNLAAQISNPTDLVGPRGMTPIDATNRAAVITTYREAPTQ